MFGDRAGIGLVAQIGTSRLDTAWWNNSSTSPKKTLSGERGDERWRTTGHLLRDAAGRHPDRVAIVDVDRTLTYRELLVEAQLVAGALLTRGVEVGDTVAIWAPNSWRWMASGSGSSFARSGDRAAQHPL